MGASLTPFNHSLNASQWIPPITLRAIKGWRAGKDKRLPAVSGTRSATNRGVEQRPARTVIIASDQRTASCASSRRNGTASPMSGASSSSA